MNDLLQPFQSFTDNAIRQVRQHENILGLAVGGSWVSGELDAYSDLDLVLVSRERIAPDVQNMRAVAAQLGTVLASFRGDHVGEPRLLIALYEAPLLHVDIKFLVPEELHQRVEDPVVLWERNGALTAMLKQSAAVYPPLDFQGLEDRFWVWVHYAALKIGRGEFMEATDFLAFVRSTVLGPLLHLKYQCLPRGVRRAEVTFSVADLIRLKSTVAAPDRISLLESLTEAIDQYVGLRDALAPATLQKNSRAESAVIEYLTAV